MDKNTIPFQRSLDGQYFDFIYIYTPPFRKMAVFDSTTNLGSDENNPCLKKKKKNHFPSPSTLMRLLLISRKGVRNRFYHVQAILTR